MLQHEIPFLTTSWCLTTSYNCPIAPRGSSCHEDPEQPLTAGERIAWLAYSLTTCQFHSGSNTFNVIPDMKLSDTRRSLPLQLEHKYPPFPNCLNVAQ